MIQALAPTNSVLPKKFYKVNSQGYRAPEFDSPEVFDSTWVFGCSFAFGWALAEQFTISRCLTDTLGEPVINLGQGGSSIRYQVDQFALLLSQGLRPRRVAVIWPDPQRWPWVGSLGPLQPQLSQQLFWAHSADEEYTQERARRDIREFRVMAALIHAPLAELSWSKATRRVMGDDYDLSYPQIDTAQDGQHPGPHSNLRCAGLFRDQWLAAQHT
jgi:hypothetical protein